MINNKQITALFTVGFSILGSIFIGLGTNAYIGLGVFCCLGTIDGLLGHHK
jgi:hypothetical protein